LTKQGRLTGPVLFDQVAAISVGYVADELALDLCYAEDSAARVDLNLVATAKQEIVEVQGTAEGRAVPRTIMDQMVDLGLTGIAELARLQEEALASQDVDLKGLLVS